MNALCLFSLVKSQCILSFKASQRLRGGVPSKNWGTYIINSMHDFYCIALVFCWCWSAIDLWQVHVKRKRVGTHYVEDEIEYCNIQKRGYLKNEANLANWLFLMALLTKSLSRWKSIRMKSCFAKWGIYNYCCSRLKECIFIS